MGMPQDDDTSPKILKVVEQRDSRQEEPVSHITFLPPEILTLIFKHLYDIVRQVKPKPLRICFHMFVDYIEVEMSKEECVCDPGPDETEWYEYDNLSSSSLFPYSIASVYPQWRDIAARISILWTRIVVFVDSDPTPISALRSYLEWSQDPPLQVSVLRRDTTAKDKSAPNDPMEPLRTRAVINTLFPHLHRFESLTFDVIYSTSLPSMTRDFYRVTPSLKNLKLKCQIYDGSCLNSAPVQNKVCEPFSASAVSTLTLDGDTFLDALKVPGWTEELCSKIGYRYLSPIFHHPATATSTLFPF